MDAGILSAKFISQAEEQDIAVLGLMLDERLETFPDTPTFVEQGYDIVNPAVRMLVGPKAVSYTHLWADKYRKLKVRTNADTPADAKKARELGAEGIGLCRTEHMFFEGNRIDAFREMICSETLEEREAALEKILPEQQGDFEKLYEALEGLSLIHIYGFCSWLQAAGESSYGGQQAFFFWHLYGV